MTFSSCQFGVQTILTKFLSFPEGFTSRPFIYTKTTLVGLFCQNFKFHVLQITYKNLKKKETENFFFWTPNRVGLQNFILPVNEAGGVNESTPTMLNSVVHEITKDAKTMKATF